MHVYCLQDGATALILAAGRGNLEVARLLIENGAKVNHASNVSRQEPHSCFGVHMLCRYITIVVHVEISCMHAR